MNDVILYREFSPFLLENIETSQHYVKLFEDFNSTMETLKSAISNRFQCTIYYKGERKGIIDDGFRKIEPYALGVNHLGNNVLRAWLIEGKSRRGNIDRSQVPGWRLYRIDRIFSISLSTQTFTKPQKKYNSEDSHMTEVMYSVQF